jgi:Secretion system C-terminal sorting domain
MKNNYILFALFLTSLFFSKLNAQVPNGGFENWFDNYLYSEPLPYFTSNFQSFFMTGQGNVTEVAGVTDSALRLETITDGIDIVPGSLILAEIEDGDFSGGWPFSSEPDSLTGYFRHSIPDGDTASILLIFTSNLAPVNIMSFPIVGESLDFTYYAFELPEFFFAPDSLTAIISSSNANDPQLGGWLEIDNLQFTNSTDQFPNNDFNDWSDIETEEPEDWFTPNFVSVISNSPVSITKSTDSRSGNYAMRIETVEISFFGDSPDTIGYTSTGTVGDEGIEGGFPYTGQPDKLSGYYKFEPVGNDTALVNVIFSKYNAIAGETDILMDVTIKLPTASDYSLFEIPIDLSEIPDTANVTIGSSNFDEEESFVGVGSVLLVDDIRFEFVNGTNEPLFAEEALIFPNPASDFTTLDLNSIKGNVQSIQFYDVLGREVLRLDNLESSYSSLNINTLQLKNGIYWYLIKTDLAAYSGKLQVERK